MIRLFFVLAVVAVNALIAANLAGTWTGVINGGGLTVLTLTQNGNEVSGDLKTFVDRRPIPIERAEFHGDELTFELHDNDKRLMKFRLLLIDGMLKGERIGDTGASKVTFSPVQLQQPSDAPNTSDSPPVLIHKVEPEYTPEGRAAKLQGTVLVEVEIGQSGTISQEVRVLRSIGMGLDEKAIECVKQWRFKPAYKDGKPVAKTARIEVNFRL